MNNTLTTRLDDLLRAFSVQPDPAGLVTVLRALMATEWARELQQETSGP